MIRNKHQMRQDVGWHFRQKTRMTHVVHIGHVVFGDHLIFRATVCKNDSPYAIGPLSVLSVTFVYCGQTVGL